MFHVAIALFAVTAVSLIATCSKKKEPQPAAPKPEPAAPVVQKEEPLAPKPAPQPISLWRPKNPKGRTLNLWSADEILVDATAPSNRTISTRRSSDDIIGALKGASARGKQSAEPSGGQEVSDNGDDVDPSLREKKEAYLEAKKRRDAKQRQADLVERTEESCESSAPFLVEQDAVGSTEICGSSEAPGKKESTTKAKKNASKKKNKASKRSQRKVK